MCQSYINKTNRNINILNIDECIYILYFKYKNDILISKMLSDLEYIIFEFNTNDIITQFMINQYKNTLNMFYKMKNIKYFYDDYIILYTYLSFYTNTINKMKDGSKNILKNKTFEIPETINNVYINRYINVNIENIVLETIRQNFSKTIDVQNIILLLRNDEEFKTNIKNYINNIILDDNNFISRLISKLPIDDLIKNNDNIKRLINESILNANVFKNKVDEDKLIERILSNPSIINKFKNIINESIILDDIINKIVKSPDIINLLNSQDKNIINIDDLIDKLNTTDKFKNMIKNIINNDLLSGKDISKLVDLFKNADEKFNNFQILEDTFNSKISEVNQIYINTRDIMQKMISNFEDVLEKLVVPINDKSKEINKKIEIVGDEIETANKKLINYVETIDKNFDIVISKEKQFEELIKNISKETEEFKNNIKENITQLINNMSQENILKALDIQDIELTDNVKTYINSLLPSLIIDYFDGEYLNSDKFNVIVNKNVSDIITPEYINNIIKSHIPKEHDIIKNVEKKFNELYNSKFNDLREYIDEINIDTKKNNTNIIDITKDITQLKNETKNELISINDFSDEKAKIDKILKYLNIKPENLESNQSNIDELIKYYTTGASVKIKEIILNILNKILSDSNINIDKLSDIDNIDDKIIKTVNLLKTYQLNELKSVLSNFSDTLYNDLNSKIEDIKIKIEPLITTENNIAGIYNELSDLSDKYNVIFNKIDNIKFIEIKNEIEYILNYVSTNVTKVIETIKHNLMDLNNIVYNQQNQGNIVKYIIETENTLKGYAETLNKVIYVINSLNDTPTIDVIKIPPTNNTNIKKYNNNINNLLEYNKSYKASPAIAGNNQLYENPLLNNIYTKFYTKYVGNKNLNIYNLNDSYKTILNMYDNDIGLINKVMKDLQTYKVYNMSYYIIIKKYIKILNEDKNNFLLNLYKRYIKYGYLILKFRIVYNTENIDKNIILFFLNKIIINAIKRDILYEYIKLNYTLTHIDTKSNLIDLSQKIILNYAYMSYLKNINNENIEIYNLFHDNFNNKHINIELLFYTNYLELSSNDKIYFNYLLNIENLFFEKYMKYIVCKDINIKNYMNFLLFKHIIINNNIKLYLYPINE
ncbi:unknown similar to AMEV156 [Adoxophyes honmai entomopoxvirus 'L']|uniref:Uncharacterized protein n=1 Tax=Adoxophyes honmai entomopoxvirus 'L' TaxID=1293540 RepID=A0A916NX17_9POXV|nr:unknown similar to AMEV156 [Adoxophyes honmai entomopoxvirus 'L']CCU55498.1 unknown similar to AMEV156 [Adoxophyes honmai entomopoxvirus 'L']